MNGSFYEQLGSVAGVFEQWGACERTVVACVLARRVPWPGLRLLQRAVEAALTQHSLEDELLEREANDETYITGLLTPHGEEDDDDGDKRLHKLMTLVPLLRNDNIRVKEAYVTSAPALVQRAVDSTSSAAAPALCRQLLSYLLVHPSLTHADQRTLTQWLRYLENHISGNRNADTVWQQRIDPCLVPDANIWSNPNPFRRTIGKNVEFRTHIDSVDHFTTDLLQESFSKNGRDVDISSDNERVNFDATISQPKSQRSNSLTPPSTNFLQMSSSAENLSDEPFVQKPRSFSLSSEHSLAQLRPLAVLYGTTGSETRLDDLRSNNYTEHPGMSNVAPWLKSLRLHKYVWLFTNITYEQMLAIDEKYLEKLGVTKGARHKILLSIKKLGERPALVESVEAELQRCSGGVGAVGSAAPGSAGPGGVGPGGAGPGGVGPGGAGPGGVGPGSAGPGVVARALQRLRGALLAPLPPRDPLAAHIVRVLHLASKCVQTNGCVGAPLMDDGDPEAPDPLSLHCWLVEKALHHEAFNSPELLAALKRLRHRLPPRQFFHHVGDLPHYRRAHKPNGRWRLNQATRGAGGANGAGGGGGRGAWGARGPGGAAPRHVDYAGLDALALQMTEHAID